MLRRDGITWDVAAITLVATAFTAAFVHAPLQWLSTRVYADGHVVAAVALQWLSRAWWLFVLIALARALSPRPLARTLFAAVLAFLVSAVTWWWLPGAPVVAQDRAALAARVAAEAADEAAVPPADDDEQAPLEFDPEAVMYDQPRLLDAAIAALQPRRPGQPNLYVIAFAGDGNEDVFRNEAEYVERLFATRFGAAGHVLVLENHAHTVATRPLATWTNLQRALGAIAGRMDPANDILFLYLTSHGSADHELYVNLDPLPLNAITPDDLAEALRTSPSMRWKVIVVNACYAGGFIDALADDSTLVMAAARSDRTSFGCGSESEITFFGKALLADGLNQTTSFVEAFEQARLAVAEREKREAIEPPSEPQIATSRRIEAHLETWRRTLGSGEPVPFAPAGASPSP
ncbi:MAG: caspase family protein [Xanthomonadales bacterium]|nr:caspase family protein [Xanthomonadales bacterium]